MSRKVSKKSFLKEDGTLVVHFEFGNGSTRTWEMPPSHPLFAQAALHGLNQKFGDSFAGVEDPEDQAECFDAVAAALNEGKWSTRVVGAEAKGGSLLARALSAILGKSLAEAKEIVRGLPVEERRALELVPKVAEKIRELRAAQTPASKAAEVASRLGIA